MKLWRLWGHKPLSGRINGANRAVLPSAQPSQLLLSLLKKAGI